MTPFRRRHKKNQENHSGDTFAQALYSPPTIMEVEHPLLEERSPKQLPSGHVPLPVTVLHGGWLVSLEQLCLTRAADMVAGGGPLVHRFSPFSVPGTYPLQLPNRSSELPRGGRTSGEWNGFDRSANGASFSFRSFSVSVQAVRSDWHEWSERCSREVKAEACHMSSKLGHGSRFGSVGWRNTCPSHPRSLWTWT